MTTSAMTIFYLMISCWMVVDTSKVAFVTIGISEKSGRRCPKASGMRNTFWLIVLRRNILDITKRMRNVARLLSRNWLYECPSGRASS